MANDGARSGGNSIIGTMGASRPHLCAIRRWQRGYPPSPGPATQSYANRLSIHPLCACISMEPASRATENSTWAGHEVGLRQKIHAVVDANGLPVQLGLTLTLPKIRRPTLLSWLPPARLMAGATSLAPVLSPRASI